MLDALEIIGFSSASSSFDSSDDAMSNSKVEEKVDSCLGWGKPPVRLCGSLVEFSILNQHLIRNVFGPHRIFHSFVGMSLALTPIAAGNAQTIPWIQIARGSPMVNSPDPGDRQQSTAVWQLAPNESQAVPASLPVRLDGSSESDQSTEFRPTTQLSGEASLVLIQASGDRPVPSEPLRTSLGHRLRLEVETSFSGEDRLSFRFQTANVAELDDVFDTSLARLSIQGDDDNQLKLSRLDYTFPLGDRTEVFVQAVGGSISDIADPLNPLLSSSGSGSISRFGQRNPLYRQGGGAGIGLSHDVSDRLNLSAGYLSDAENLLFQEESVAFVQATYEATDTVDMGLLYVYGLNAIDSGTGSQQANNPFDDRSDTLHSHSIGLQATANLTPQLTLSGWAGWTRAIASDLPDRPQTDLLNWAFTLGYTDLWGDNNLGGLVIGQPPQVVAPAAKPDAAFHIELFYQIQMTDNMVVTPGIVLITTPEGDSGRSPIIVGTIRTTFQF